MQKNQQEIEKENLVKHISELKVENLKIDEDNIRLRSENEIYTILWKRVDLIHLQLDLWIVKA